MEDLREEAAAIKAKMIAEKGEQDQKDGEAEQLFGGINASGRKIAHPKGKSGRFSDVHKAQFRKMDSIENHASAYRARPGFAQPTQQSLKRTSEKAGLDELERPRTAGKGNPGKPAPPFMRSQASSNSLRPTKSSLDRSEVTSPAKRPRQSAAQDVSHGRVQEQATRPHTSSSAIPRPVSSTLLSPTKVSMARATAPEKTSMLPRSNSVKSLKPAFEAARSRPSSSGSDRPMSSFNPFRSASLPRPLPQLPSMSSSIAQQSAKETTTTPKNRTLSSRLPTFSGLKSILRSTSRKVSGADRSPTPKRPTTAGSAVESSKKVDFTPSVKSRHAVKLAARSPSPAKHHTALLEDPADADTEPEDHGAEWEDASSDVEYPNLPPADTETGPVIHTFSQKVKEHGRRESREFKSIFLTLGGPDEPVKPSTLTSIKTKVNQARPLNHTDTIMKSPSNPDTISQSPSTIRRVRSSDVAMMEPLHEIVHTVPHGLTAKKRRHDAAVKDDKFADDDDAKENRRVTMMPQIPGGWDEAVLDEDEGEKRGGKRMRVAKSAEPSPNKKPNAAREMASKNAKDRKKGILTLSKLNLLSKPKQRA